MHVQARGKAMEFDDFVAESVTLRSNGHNKGGSNYTIHSLLHAYWLDSK
jgi:hypothetical protein